MRQVLDDRHTFPVDGLPALVFAVCTLDIPEPALDRTGLAGFLRGFKFGEIDGDTGRHAFFIEEGAGDEITQTRIPVVDLCTGQGIIEQF
jgi:hypothetical protein